MALPGTREDLLTGERILEGEGVRLAPKAVKILKGIRKLSFTKTREGKKIETEEG